MTDTVKWQRDMVQVGWMSRKGELLSMALMADHGVPHESEDPSVPWRPVYAVAERPNREVL